MSQDPKETDLNLAAALEREVKDANEKLDNLGVETSETETSPAYTLAERIGFLAAQNDSLQVSLEVRTRQRDEVDAKWEKFRTDYTAKCNELLAAQRQLGVLLDYPGMCSDAHAVLDTLAVPTHHDPESPHLSVAERIQWLANNWQSKHRVVVEEHAELICLKDTLVKAVNAQAKMIEEVVETLDDCEIPVADDEGHTRTLGERVQALAFSRESQLRRAEDREEKLSYAEIDADELRLKLDSINSAATQYRDIIARYHRTFAHIYQGALVAADMRRAIEPVTLCQAIEAVVEIKTEVTPVHPKSSD